MFGWNRDGLLCAATLGVTFSAGLWLGKKLFSQRYSLLRTFKSHGDAKGDPLMDYVIQNSLREHPILKKLRMRTLQDRMCGMLVACEQAQFMGNLAKLIKARNVLEIGVYTGYNSLNMALAIPDDGKVIACDISLEYANIGIPYWREAGVEHKIDLRIKPATETLDELLEAGKVESFDFAFIDADKLNYGVYYEKCLQLIRKGGIIAIDNVLWGGSVLNPGNDADTLSIVKLNEKIYRDSRVNMSMLTLGDGVTLVFKL
ncbi:catechol O-methyltransferase domain-containing protein 1 [Stegostoma tigrinum]|uniref:catechol O-methyltransferase domain-containing protein 1 n=1 Tax=Stegostoma tigrinum TaxID=3053191 RepID=UPI00202B38E9|nr:catechol O-methyltransferase domain-containing protein 1 [Stegostoma tigrinum]